MLKLVCMSYVKFLASIPLSAISWIINYIDSYKSHDFQRSKRYDDTQIDVPKKVIRVH